MLAVFHLFQSFGYYGFGTLAALVLVSRGYDVTSSLLFTALSFIGYPVGSALAIPLLKLFERKFLLMGTIGALAAFGLLFATVHNTALIVVFGFMTTLTSNVFSNVYHVYQAEIFPTDVRATAVGWTYSLSRLSSGALPFILIPVLDSLRRGGDVHGRPAGTGHHRHRHRSHRPTYDAAQPGGHQPGLSSSPAFTDIPQPRLGSCLRGRGTVKA